jgi:starch phosphorylase
VGVGLLYRHGYFRQSLSRDGWQQETYPVLDPDELPISVLREDDGSVAKVTVGMPGGQTASARVWVAQVGRVPLLLLDSDVEENVGVLRDITDRLYGGNTEHRLRQEMLLGIGGMRAIRLYSRLTGNAAPEVFHTNEGHAGFLGLERIRELTEDQGLDFTSALEVSRAGTVFTTLRCPRGSTASRASSSSSTSAATMPARGCRSTRSWRSVPRTSRAVSPTSSTWR